MKRFLPFVLLFFVALTASAGEVYIDGQTNDGHIIQEEGSTIAQDPIMNFVGDDITVGRAGGKTVVTVDTTVTGDATYLKLDASNDPLQPSSDSTTFFQIMDADGGTPIFNIDSTNERVGIGVTDPDTKLEILNAGDQLKLSFDADSFATFAVDTNDDLTIKPAASGGIRFQPTTTDTTDFFQVLDQDGGTPVLNVDSTNESVGIGTVSPKHLLDVGGMEGIGAPGNLGIKSDSGAWAIRIEENSGVEGWHIGVDVDGDLNFDDSNTGIRLTFQDETGNVGIGTTSPGRDLEIYDSSPALRIRDSGATAGATTSYVEFGGTDATAWNRTGFVGDAASGNADIYLQAEVGDLHLGDSSGSTVMNLHTGNVGIGTAGPSEKLTVEGGDALVSDDSPWWGLRDSDTNDFHFLHGGELNTDTSFGCVEFYAKGVHDGTTASVGAIPFEQPSWYVGDTDNYVYFPKGVGGLGGGILNVAGAINITDEATGYQMDGITFLASNASANVEIGPNIAGGTGDFGHTNILIGDSAGYNLDQAGGGNNGAYNVFVGADCGYGDSGTNNTGKYNVGFGYRTLQSLTSGLQNMGIGYQSLNALTSGSNNVGIGNYALLGASTASNNIAIGTSSSYFNNGANNTAIGFEAGKGASGSSGWDNVFIGHSAGLTVTSSYQNVGIGKGALDAVTSGPRNTAVGYGAGSALNSGYRNTMLGFYAGLELTNGDDNILIGHYGGDEVSTQNNVLIIDNQNDASYATEQASAIIYGVMAALPADQTLTFNADVGIGTISPTAALQMGDDKLIAVDVNAGLTASTTQEQGQGALTAQVNEISTVANDGDTITLPSAVTGVEIEIINNGAKTLRIFPASGDDLGLGTGATTSFEELEANERVKFVAYDTTNWAKESSTEIIHAEIHDEDNTDAFVVNAEDDFHSYHTNGFAAGDLADWTFDAGGAGTSHAIDSIADGTPSGTDIAVTTGTEHGLEVGDIVSQTDLTSAVYTGIFVVKDINSDYIYEVAAVYTATDTGTMDQAATLEADAVAAGVYSFAYYISASPVNPSETFDFQLYKEATAVTGSKIRRKFGAGGDFGSMSGGGVVSVGNGEKISFALSNEDSAVNLTIRNLTIVLIRL